MFSLHIVYIYFGYILYCCCIKKQPKQQCHVQKWVGPYLWSRVHPPKELSEVRVVLNRKCHKLYENVFIKNFFTLFFQLKKILLGTDPVHIGGIKTYRDTKSKDEIIVDVDVSFNGDAKVIFTLQVKVTSKQEQDEVLM